jgi:RNA polymerase sigma-70 factor (ECF subfamily)
MVRSGVAQVFAREWPVLVAALTRDLGDLALAEEVAQEAFVEAAARWGPDTTPDRPGAWLLTTARRKAIDNIRRERRLTDRLPALQALAAAPPRPPTELIDDQLALIFGCCHTSLSLEAQVALTLREVCGLSTNQIAGAFVVSPATMAKRLVRAKNKIRVAGVPFVVPGPDDLPDRLTAVLHVIYLIFTAGHTASEGRALVRGDLCDEARWLAEILDHLLAQRGQRRDLPRAATPESVERERSEVLGLRALMAFTDARRAARSDDEGNLVLLEDQDRSRWDRALVAEGQGLLARAASARRIGPYQLQAAIAGLHSAATCWDATDWATIVELYDRLVDLSPGPVVELNRAVAVSMHHGPEAGLAAVDDLVAAGGLDRYRYLHAARADLLRRLGRDTEAVTEYRRALELSENEPERRFLHHRIDELTGGETDG